MSEAMTSDLIGRLQHYSRGGSGPVNEACAEAVVEIERLTAEVESLKAKLREAEIYDGRYGLKWVR